MSPPAAATAERARFAPGAPEPLRDDLGLFSGNEVPKQAPGDQRRRGPAHLRVVPRRSPFNIRKVRVVIAAAGFGMLAVVFGLVGLHVLLAQNQLRLDRLQTRAATAKLDYQRLRLTVDQLEAPSRIVSEAEQRLGMVLPPTLTYLAPVSGVNDRVRGATPDRSGARRSGPSDTAASPKTTVAPAGSAAWPSIKAELDKTQ